MPYKPLADSTLKAMTKAEIIKLLRIAEHNFFAMEEVCNNQYEYGKELLAENAKLNHLIDKHNAEYLSDSRAVMDYISKDDEDV